MKIRKTILSTIALVAMSTVALATPAQAADLNFDFTLTTESSMGLSPADDCSPWPGDYYYETLEFQVTQTGSYFLTNYESDHTYSYIALYSQPFDGANPDAGCLATSSRTTPHSATLEANTSYWAYLSTVPPSKVGAFKGTISGPGDIILGATTTTSLSVTPSNVSVGDSVTLVATVVGTVAGTSVVTNPTGTVDFFNGTDLIGSSAVSSGEASFTYTPTTSGRYELTARYNGDAANGWSGSTAFSLEVNAIPDPSPAPKPIPAPTPPVKVDTAAR